MEISTVVIGSRPLQNYIAQYLHIEILSQTITVSVSYSPGPSNVSPKFLGRFKLMLFTTFEPKLHEI